MYQREVPLTAMAARIAEEQERLKQDQIAADEGFARIYNAVAPNFENQPASIVTEKMGKGSLLFFFLSYSLFERFLYRRGFLEVESKIPFKDVLEHHHLSQLVSIAGETPRAVELDSLTLHPVKYKTRITVTIKDLPYFLSLRPTYGRILPITDTDKSQANLAGKPLPRIADLEDLEQWQPVIERVLDSFKPKNFP